MSTPVTPSVARRVPTLGANGRFPDEYTPQGALDAVAASEAAQGKAEEAQQAAEEKAQELANAKGTANGIASLDGGAKVPESQLPTRLGEQQLSSTFVSLKAAAKNPDLLIVGGITRDDNQAVTAADVVWPDGTPGTFTALKLSTAFPGAVDGYKITYGSPVTKTFTQPDITRNTAGAATTVPQIVVS